MSQFIGLCVCGGGGGGGQANLFQWEKGTCADREIFVPGSTERKSQWFIIRKTSDCLLGPRENYIFLHVGSRVGPTNSMECPTFSSGGAKCQFL